MAEVSATVVGYSANPWDTELTLKVECLKCSIEWGWSKDSSGAFERLEDMAANHNAEHHETDNSTDEAYERFKEARYGD